jgi:hypothetical protein
LEGEGPLIASILASVVGRVVMGGAFSVILIGAVVMWHKANFVPAVEVEYWKKYSEQLIAGIEKQKQTLSEYEDKLEEHDNKLKELEKENERLYEEESNGDNPVVLDRDDVKRLRRFKESIR